MFAGKPVPQGTITFAPDASKGVKGPAGSASIVNGEYDTSKGGIAIVGGAHRISITGYDGNADPENELPLGKSLFQDYQQQYDFPPVPDPIPEEPQTIDFDVPANASQPRRTQQVHGV